MAGMAPAQKAKKGRFVGVTIPGNTAPTLSIDTATPTALAGTATDSESGDISASISWSSDLDGALGSGASLTVALSTGTHTITATVSDGINAPVTATASVVVP